MKKSMMIGVGVIAALAAGIQFIRPDRTNPSSDPGSDLLSVLSPPAQVREILQRSCYDCHSHQTRWPWYSAAAPASWLVAADVREGREHLNFSVWGSYPRGRRIAKLESMIAEVDKGSMPPGTYLLMHREATLGAAEKEALLLWMENTADSLTNESE